MLRYTAGAVSIVVGQQLMDRLQLVHWPGKVPQSGGDTR